MEWMNPFFTFLIKKKNRTEQQTYKQSRKTHHNFFEIDLNAGIQISRCNLFSTIEQSSPLLIKTVNLYASSATTPQNSKSLFSSNHRRSSCTARVSTPYPKSWSAGCGPAPPSRHLARTRPRDRASTRFPFGVKYGAGASFYQIFKFRCRWRTGLRALPCGMDGCCVVAQVP